MNKKREAQMEELAYEVDDFQRNILPKIKRLFVAERQANKGMAKMPVNWRNGESAITAQAEKSDISLEGLKEAYGILDKKLTEVYLILSSTYL